MRLISVKAVSAFIEDVQVRSLRIVLDDGGTQHKISIALPDGYDTWTRAEKVVWAKAWLADHALTHRYVSGADAVFPDVAVKDAALVDFDNLPGFASWTAQEAQAWIDTNVTDLASAKVALVRMAQAIVFLRDIVIGR